MYMVSCFRNVISHAQFPGVMFRNVIYHGNFSKYDAKRPWRKALMHMHISNLCSTSENYAIKLIGNICIISMIIRPHVVSNCIHSVNILSHFLMLVFSSDINECENANVSCSDVDNRMCVNNRGSYSCECADGYYEAYHNGTYLCFRKYVMLLGRVVVVF